MNMTGKRKLLTAAAGLGILAALPFATALGEDSDGEGDGGDATVLAATELSTAFTYQGRLDVSDNPADGAYDMRFIMYDAASGGSQVGETVTKEDVTVTEGLFAVELDFGGSAFDGEARWLEVAVRTGAATGDFNVLNPRQPISAVPYAIHALSAASFALPSSASGSTETLTTLLEIEQEGTGNGLSVDRTSADSSPGMAIIGQNSGAGAAINAVSSYATGTGVVAQATGEDGVGGSFQGATSINLDGVISVSGSNAPAFVHTASANNRCLDDRATAISNPVTNGDPDRMLIVTYQAATGSLLTGPASAFGVIYNDGSIAGCTEDSWLIYLLDDSESLSIGDRFNVLVIQP
jgi:hypothetical protein